MLSRWRACGLVRPTIWLLPALALLVWLGTWQLQRLAWKEALIAGIKSRIVAEPIPIEDAEARLRANPDTEYLRVTGRGTFLLDSERFLYAPDQRLGPGYHVFTPFVLQRRLGPRSGCGDYVLVNRGFVPEALKSPDTRQFGRDARGDLVVGLLRLPERPSAFAPASDLKRNLWFWRDLPGMAASLLLPAQPACADHDAPRALPFAIDAEPEETRVNPQGWPKGGTTILDIPNRHLDYAMTWYGLAVTLLVVFGVFAHGRLQAQPSAASDRPAKAV